MAKSMTGFGRGEATDGVRTVVAEIKAVNHRFGEISVKMPRRYQFAEEAVKSQVRAKTGRGKIDVSISFVSSADEDVAVMVNLPVAKQYFKGLRTLQNEFDVAGEIGLDLLANLPDVMKAGTGETDEAAVRAVLADAVGAALEKFDAMRMVEGEKLAADILDRVGLIEGYLNIVDERAPELPGIYAVKLNERIQELLKPAGSVAPPEERLAVEVAFFADKANITEEIVRLRSHLSQIGKMLGEKGGEKGPVGKKLDFILQEINRETNTIGSKANDLKITNTVLEMKSETEKIREQIQNIE
jgi:uncharacterized protein (TIGR00255 family)